MVELEKYLVAGWGTWSSHMTMFYNKWTPDSVGTTFQTIFSLSGSRQVFHNAVWQADSVNYTMQVLVDSQEIFNLDFQELDTDFHLAAVKTQDIANIQTNFDIIRYDTNRWLWKPSEPFEFNNSMEIRIRANTGTVSLLRGLTGYRKL